MVLRYLAQDAIDDIKTNFSKYKDHFLDPTNQWFVRVFEEKGWLKESKFRFEEIVLDKSEDFNISDRRNIEILYSGLRELSPALASDERVWTGLLFDVFWDFVQYRRKEELSGGDEQSIKNSFFFMRGIKRSCFVNCLSRLWWTGYLIYDKEAKNHFSAADLLCDGAYASTILLFSSSNFTSQKNIALGILDCMAERKAKGEKIGRYHYVEANKYLNSLGGIMLLDTISRDEIHTIIDRRLDKYVG